MNRMNTLNDQIDASVVTTESIGGHASKQGRIGSFQLFDAQVGQDSSRQDFFANSVPDLKSNVIFLGWLIVKQVAEKLPRIALGIQSFAVHVPQNANWFLSFSFTLKDGRFASAGSLILELDLKLRRGYETNTIWLR